MTEPDGADGLIVPTTTSVNASQCRHMNRSTLRGTLKVNTQWKLYCLAHNLEKIGRYGAANN